MEGPGEGSNKIKGISQIVKLKKILHKWQKVTVSSKTEKPLKVVEHPGGIAPEITRRLKISDMRREIDDEHGCQSPEPSHGVPKGYLAVYVGPELRRFIIPTGYLSDPLFKVLLEKVEEEFGFDHSGALTIPCETETFKYLIQCMENHMKEDVIQDENNNTTSPSPERIESSEKRENPGTSSTPTDL